MKQKKPSEQKELALLWWKKLKETNNETFLPLFFDTNRYLVLMGGGGSGKSLFAGRKVLERVTSEKGHRWLVCRKIARTLQDSCFRQLCAQANEFYPNSLLKINTGELSIKFKNGSEILFYGLDDVEKLKSIYHITGIWIEEATEISESDLNQLDIRLRANTEYYKQIIISFNPVSVKHWLKKRFFDVKHDNVTTHHSTYRDNRFLGAEAVKVLEEFKKTDHYYYTVYCLGRWGVLGKTVFDAKVVVSRQMKNIKPVKTGRFVYEYDGLRLTNIRFVEEKDGFIKLYEAVKPGYPYVIGGDTAGEGSDSFVAQVLDNTTGKQVAVLRHSFDEDVYARQVFCLGMYYNTALVGIETNFSTYPTKEMARLGYAKLYTREVEDNYTGKLSDAYGFKTTSLTRPLILGQLIQAVREDITLVSDADTLDEMLTFVRNEQMRPEAEKGCHDDCIMALAIAFYIRNQGGTTVSVKGNKALWTRDQWEDYRNATQQEKAYLIQKWGEPKR